MKHCIEAYEPFLFSLLCFLLLPTTGTFGSQFVFGAFTCYFTLLHVIMIQTKGIWRNGRRYGLKNFQIERFLVIKKQNVLKFRETGSSKEPSILNQCLIKSLDRVQRRDENYFDSRSNENKERVQF